MNNLIIFKQFPSLEKIGVYITKLILFIYAGFFHTVSDIRAATKRSRGKVFGF